MCVRVCVYMCKCVCSCACLCVCVRERVAECNVSLSKGGTRDALVKEIMNETMLAKVELAERGESQVHTQNNTFFFL